VIDEKDISHGNEINVSQLPRRCILRCDVIF
jgi:hypothetical protein